MSLLNAFLDDEFFQTINVNIRCISSSIRITALNRLNDRCVLFWHIFSSSEIIIVDISESENQFLQLFDHLHQNLVMAGINDRSMEFRIIGDHIFHTSTFHSVIIFI